MFQMQHRDRVLRRNEIWKSKNERKKEDHVKSKNIMEKEDEDKFCRVLARCKRLISRTMSHGGDIFELLDPLIADTQCHLHSVLLLNIVRRCYDYEKSIYNGIEKLDDEDKRILTYAVLFSVLKIKCKDGLDFSVHGISIRNFNCLVLPSINREKHYISEAKEKFNSHSVEHIRSVATEKIKEILNECKVTAHIAQLKFLPCYASIHAVIGYIKKEKLPIIISLLYFTREVVDLGTKYSINNNNNNNDSVRFYEFREEDNSFFYKEVLTESEKKLPTIAFRCYTSSSDGIRESLVKCNVEDLLMACCAIHTQLPKNAILPAGCEDGEEYVRKLYEKHADFINEYNRHCELAKQYNLGIARYSRLVQISVEPECEEMSLTVERNREEIFFTLDHICASNYTREYQDLTSLGTGLGQVGQHEVLKINQKKRTREALGRLLDSAPLFE